MKKSKLEKLLLQLPTCIKVKDSEYPIKHLEIIRDGDIGYGTWFIQYRATDEEDDDEFTDTGIYMVGDDLEELVKRTLKCLKKDKYIKYIKGR